MMMNLVQHLYECMWKDVHGAFLCRHWCPWYVGELMCICIHVCMCMSKRVWGDEHGYHVIMQGNNGVYVGENHEMIHKEEYQKWDFKMIREKIYWL